ncbi:MAG: hypothetical protein WD468_03210 [Pirellulales bacterium]
MSIRELPDAGLLSVVPSPSGRNHDSPPDPGYRLVRVASADFRARLASQTQPAREWRLDRPVV